MAFRATGAVNPPRVSKKREKLKSLEPALKVMASILARRWVEGKVMGTTAQEQLKIAVAEEPEFARLVQESKYTSYRTLWDHLRASQGAKMQAVCEVAPRKTAQAQKIAREMIGTDPVGWPLRGQQDLRHLALPSQGTEQGWRFNLKKLHPFVVFTDNLSVDLRDCLKRKGIYVPPSPSVNPDPDAPAPSGAARTNPILGKSVGSLPVATFYHSVNEELGSWSHLLHTGAAPFTQALSAGTPVLLPRHFWLQRPQLHWCCMKPRLMCYYARPIHECKGVCHCSGAWRWPEVSARGPHLLG